MKQPLGKNTSLRWQRGDMSIFYLSCVNDKLSHAHKLLSHCTQVTKSCTQVTKPCTQVTKSLHTSY